MANCRTCGAQIIWMKTQHGKNIPVDYDKDIAREKEFDSDRMVAHFATCPDAKQHRRGDMND